MVALIDSTVSATTRHSDNVPIASEVAIALVIREEAIDAGRLSKPAVPGDRIMVQILAMRGRITRGIGKSRRHRRQHCGESAWKAAK
jgi:hypothetical protein